MGCSRTAFCVFWMGLRTHSGVWQLEQEAVLHDATNSLRFFDVSLDSFCWFVFLCIRFFDKGRLVEGLVHCFKEDVAATCYRCCVLFVGLKIPFSFPFCSYLCLLFLLFLPFLFSFLLFSFLLFAFPFLSLSLSFLFLSCFFWRHSFSRKRGECFAPHLRR